MKSQELISQPVTSSRRTFLKRVGVLGAASMCGNRAVLAVPAKYAQRFQLAAEGIVSDFSLVWPAPQLPPLPPDAVVRVRIEFPINGHDILEWQTLVDLGPGVTLVVTLYHMRIDKITLSETPSPNLALFGQILDNPVVDNPNHSPFGDLTGRVGIIYAGFDAAGDHTTFTLLGGAAAGSHASAVPTATGSLLINAPWQSL